jgi:hypothetical protein
MIARLASPLAATAGAAALTLVLAAPPPAAGLSPAQSDPLADPLARSAGAIPRVEADTVVLRWLDKSTARVDQVTAPVGATIALGGLDVTVRACRRTTPEQAPEDAAFLEVNEHRAGEAPRKIFQGWMFASSPSLSALEHPVYDVWVLECADAVPSEEAGGNDDTGAPGASSADSASDTASGAQ